jgi:hypothetical protein
MPDRSKRATPSASRLRRGRRDWLPIQQHGNRGIARGCRLHDQVHFAGTLGNDAWPGPNAECPSSGICDTTNPYTSYTASNLITITLTLNEARPANTSLSEQIVTRPRFSLVVNDGRQTIAWDDVEVSVLGITTDAVGRIVAWAIGLGDSASGRWIESCFVVLWRLRPHRIDAQ